MPWVRFDDQYTIHRKVNGLSDAAFRLHTEAIFWCARNLTDGRIARDELRSASGISKPARHVTELVARGCWRETDEGWEIHDYLEFQPSRSKVLQTREERKKAGAAGGVKSGESRRRSSNTSRSKSQAKPKQVASRSLEPRTRSSLREEGDGGAALRDGAAPPSPAQPPPLVTDDWRQPPGTGTGALPDAEREALRARLAASRDRHSARRPQAQARPRDSGGSCPAPAPAHVNGTKVRSEVVQDSTSRDEPQPDDQSGSEVM